MNEVSLRPQPIGLTPWPHGGLLLPDVEGAREAAQQIVERGPDDAEVPEALAFWEAARRDDIAGALALLSGSEDAVMAYNRFVLAPEEDLLEGLRQRFAGSELSALLEIAAYHAGFSPRAFEADAIDGELRAFAQATQASALLEAGERESALPYLESAAEAARVASPGLAAQLLLSRDELLRQVSGPDDEAVARLREAMALLPEGGFGLLRAELELEIGGVLQESGPGDRRRLMEAIGCYQAAVRGLDPERHRRAFGFAQMRLGLAYLSMTMHEAGDALRMGVATQALREAVKILDPQLETSLWTSAATNLANAYQILPSSHLKENLEEAMALYDRVLEHRQQTEDPAGVARVLVNRANAAASLERRTDAIDDLVRAVPLLQQCNLDDECSRARSLLESLQRSETGIGEEEGS